MKIFNVKRLEGRRRKLRANLTPHEIILWSRLRNRQLGYKFRRQHSIGNYIVDFFCADKKLAVEIDGSQHFNRGHELYDKNRTAILESSSCKVIRFTDGEINTNIEGVLMKIVEALEHHKTPPQSSLQERYTFWLLFA